MKTDNPYEWNFEEYKAWHDKVIADANYKHQLDYTTNEYFNSDEEVMKYYGAMVLDEYINKILNFPQ